LINQLKEKIGLMFCNPQVGEEIAAKITEKYLPTENEAEVIDLEEQVNAIEEVTEVELVEM